MSKNIYPFLAKKLVPSLTWFNFLKVLSLPLTRRGVPIMLILTLSNLGDEWELLDHQLCLIKIWAYSDIISSPFNPFAILV